MLRSSLAVGLILAVACVLLAGCVDDGRPATCDAVAVTVELTVSADGMDPNPVSVCRGQEVSLELRPEVDGVFHVHGLDAVLPATTIAAGEPVTLTFTPDQTGQFPVELHPADDPQGISIGIFTVHDR
jgi:hypothetical protein